METEKKTPWTNSEINYKQGGIFAYTGNKYYNGIISLPEVLLTDKKKKPRPKPIQFNEKKKKTGKAGEIQIFNLMD